MLILYSDRHYLIQNYENPYKVHGTHTKIMACSLGKVLIRELYIIYKLIKEIFITFYKIFRIMCST